MNDVEAMRNLLARLREQGGTDWAEKLAKEMLAERGDFEAIAEAYERLNPKP
jgi:hypothetical protein